MRRGLFVFLICCFYSLIISAQTPVDSLESVVASTKVDTIKINALNELSVQLRTNDPALGLQYAEKALKISITINHKKLQASSLNNIGVIHELQGDLTDAMNYYVKSLTISREIKDQVGIAKSLNNIGIVYKKENDHESAIKHYKESLAIHKKLNNKKGSAICLNNLALSYKTLEKYEEAATHYSECLELFKELNHKAGQAVVYNNLGIVSNEMGEKKEALKYYMQSLKIREEMGNKQGIAIVYNNMGELYKKYGEYNTAIAYLKTSMSMTKVLSFKELLYHNYKLLHETYGEQNKMDSAYHYLYVLSTLKDSLNQLERKNQLSELKVKFETENKEREIEVLEKEKIIRNEQVERQKWQLLSIATGLALSLIVIVMIYRNSRAKSKAKEEIEKQKQLVEQTNKELNQINEELAAQRDEIEVQKEEVEVQKSIIELKNKEITDSITYAKRIQKAILPSNQMLNTYLSQSFVMFLPKDIVAGDFYWVEKTNDKIFFAVADCTGHGVPGAMVSVVCNNALNRVVREYKLSKPSQILDKVTEIINTEFGDGKEEIRDGMDIALCMLEKNKLEFSGANNPVWIIRNGEIIETKGDRQPIGKYENKKPFTNHQIDLIDGDTIYIFTDGYVDQFGGERNKKMGYNVFRKKILEVNHLPLNEIKASLQNFFKAWKGKEEQVDDVCIQVVKI